LAEKCNVDVWQIPLDVEAVAVLSADEEIRASRFHFDGDRVRWVRSRSALRSILSRYLETPPMEIEFTLGPLGKPSVTDVRGIEFSLSHAGRWAMIAVTRGTPVGVDIEQIREGVDMGALLRRLGEDTLPEDKAGLFRAWARREAVTKAVGGALMRVQAGDFRVRDLAAPPGYAAALVLLGREPRIRRYDWLPACAAEKVPISGVDEDFL
jgi:4'-phosphopantetheinyl transferase